MPMLRRHALKLALALLLLANLHGTAAALIDSEQTIGTSGCHAAGNNSADWDTIAQCPSNGGTWQRGPYFFGASADTCDGSHEGLTCYDSTAHNLYFCNGTT